MLEQMMVRFRIPALSALLIIALLSGCAQSDASTPTSAEQPDQPMTEPAQQQSPADSEDNPGDSGAGLGSLDVINESSSDICQLYVAPTGQTDWGENWLAENQIIAANGDARNVRGFAPGSYSLKAVDCENRIIVVDTPLNLAIPDIHLYRVVDPASRLTIDNRTGSELCSLTVAPPETEAWSPVLELEAPIAPNESYEMTSLAPNHYALRMESCAGESWQVDNADLTTDFGWSVGE